MGGGDLKNKDQESSRAPPTRGPIRVLIADDEPVLRTAVGDLISGEPDLELLGAAADASEAVELAAATLPDVAVVDVRMPGGGASAVHGIHEVSPKTLVLGLSAYGNRAAVIEMLRAGAVGYLIKGALPEEILEAIRRAGRGQASLTAKMIAGVIEELARDTDERRRAGEVVRRSEEKFRGLLESAPDAVVIVDAAGTIVLVNRQTEQMFGYTREELLGQKIEQLLPKRFGAEHLALRDGYISDPVTPPIGVGLELHGTRKDGAEFPVDISLSAIETPEGQLVTAFVRDIHERVAAANLQQDLADLHRHLAERRRLIGSVVRASEEERRRIASDIHDDTVQAMTAVGLRLGLLRKRLDEPGQLAALDELEAGVRDAIVRLRNLLFALRPPELDREGLVAAIQLNLEQLKAEHGLDYELEDRLEREPDAETRTIAYRIVQEALVNTRKHAQASRVGLLFDSRGDGVFASIHDDGSGFSSSGPDAPRELGHLGLVAMRERAELAGGWLKIESAPAEGTKVEFWIPDGSIPADGEGEVAA
jgi:PAS domain S-box-containing protein